MASALRATRVLRQSFDLVAAAQKLSPQARAQVFSLKKQFDDLKRELEASPKDLDPIDWNKYTQAAHPAGSVVNQIKADFEKIKINPINVADHLKELEKLEKEAVAAAEAAKKQAEAHLFQLQKMLRELESSTSVDELTVDDVLTQNPQWKKDIQKELANDKYM